MRGPEDARTTLDAPSELELHDLALSRSGLDFDEPGRSAEAVQRLWSDGDTRVLVVSGGEVAVLTGGPSPTVLTLPPDEAPEGERIYLGRADGTRFAAVDVADDGRDAVLDRVTGAVVDAVPADASVSWQPLRNVVHQLAELDAALAVHAVGVAQWHRKHPRCSVCGQPTLPDLGGHLRRCPHCGAQHFPRTDPAIIVLIRDSHDRALLARSPSWPAGRFSTLAGFVEPGESLEMAVRRETYEETGVEVDDAMTYAGSQPWPFPSSLMLGFFGTVDGGPHGDVVPAPTGTEGIAVDGDEIETAYWFDREDYGRRLGTGELIASPSVSISRRLIEAWYGGPLPGGPGVPR